MSGNISATLRELVFERAQGRCEYCLLHGAAIQPLTPQGRVTVKMLHLNNIDRIEERQRLIVVGLYP